MVVTCENCQARFKLSDDKVTEKGVKVRCSKCRHVFVVRKGGEGGAAEASGEAPAAAPPTGGGGGGSPEFVASEDFGGFAPKGETPAAPPAAPPPPSAEVGTEHQFTFTPGFAEETKGGAPPPAEAPAAPPLAAPPPPPLARAKKDIAGDIDFGDVTGEEAELTVEGRGGEEGPRSVEANELEAPPERRPAPSRREGGASPRAAPRPVPLPPKPRSKAVTFFAVAIVLGGVAYLAYLAVGPGGGFPEVLKSKGSAAPAAAVVAGNFKHYFMKNQSDVSLFVIEGDAINQSSTPQSFIQLRAVIFAGPDQRIAERTFYAGNAFTEDQLREFTEAQFQEHLQNRVGDGLSDMNLAPGKSLPFTVVFYDARTEVTEFSVEVVSSQPAP